jgi:pyrophosphate--fructose-6-phosphate 1-phosphotransferase
VIGAQKSCYESLPIEIQMQLILDRDSHGNVVVSQIETEKLVAQVY